MSQSIQMSGLIRLIAGSLLAITCGTTSGLLIGAFMSRGTWSVGGIISLAIAALGSLGGVILVLATNPRKEGEDEWGFAVILLLMIAAATGTSLNLIMSQEGYSVWTMILANVLYTTALSAVIFFGVTLVKGRRRHEP